MPEGDTLFRTARTLHRALAGQAVTRFESVYPALTRVDVDHPIAGRTVETVQSRGKHLLMSFSDDLILHTHMRMNGAWHLYRVNERWRRPGFAMRVLVGTSTLVAVGFDIPVAEFLTGAQLARHAQIQALGPDLTDPGFDRAEVERRMAAHAAEPIAEVLLNQRVLCGIGNELKSEVLFVAGVHPFVRTGDLAPEHVGRLLDVSLRLMRLNTIESPTLGTVIGRRTTGSLDRRAKVFVYGRGGRPCRRCGTPIAAHRTGLDARLTYWCPRCQPAPAAVHPRTP